LKKIKLLLGYIAVQYTISTRKKLNALVILCNRHMKKTILLKIKNLVRYRSENNVVPLYI